MQSKRTRLDRFISVNTGINRRDVRAILAQQRMVLDGELATDIHQFVDEFTQVILDGNILQNKMPVYIMLHKPVGVVSATKDDKHTTVIDLIEHEQKHQLHIVGRLDFNTSGLVLLTNDGRWSRELTLPETKVPKRYHVTLANPVTPDCMQDYIKAFAEGMYFPYENITTRSAELMMINEFEAEVVLVEGRYHQVKRMFGRFQNPVTKLHRVAIGNLQLDESLMAGQYRLLNPQEVNNIFTKPIVLHASKFCKSDRL